MSQEAQHRAQPRVRGQSWESHRDQGKLSFLPEIKSKTEKLQLKMRHLACAGTRDREGWGREDVTSVTSGQGAGVRLCLCHQTGHSVLHRQVSSRNIMERGFQSRFVPRGEVCVRREGLLY